MKRTGVMAMAVAGILGAAGTSSAALIDSYDFSTDMVLGDSITVGPGGSDFQQYGPLLEVIGGVRTLSIPGSTPVVSNAMTVSANAFGSGNLGFSLNTGADGSAVIIWDAGGLGLGGADLTDAGASNFFTFNILAIDQGLVDLIVRVETSGGNGELLISNTGVGVQQFSFANFSGSPDFSSVDLISLEIVGTAASDLSLGEIYTSGPLNVIPEPGTLGLAALAGLSLLRLRRKDRQST